MLVVIRGGGDIATGIALRLYRSGMEVVLCERAQPTVIRRTVAFAEAVRLGETEVEGVTARRAEPEEIPGLLAKASAKEIPGALVKAILQVKSNPQH